MHGHWGENEALYLNIWQGTESEDEVVAVSRPTVAPYKGSLREYIEQERKVAIAMTLHRQTDIRNHGLDAKKTDFTSTVDAFLEGFVLKDYIDGVQNDKENIRVTRSVSEKASTGNS